jgi:hypothetical protein
MCGQRVGQLQSASKAHEGKGALPVPEGSGRRAVVCGRVCGCGVWEEEPGSGYGTGGTVLMYTAERHGLVGRRWPPNALWRHGISGPCVSRHLDRSGSLVCQKGYIHAASVLPTSVSEDLGVAAPGLLAWPAGRARHVSRV